MDLFEFPADFERQQKFVKIFLITLAILILVNSFVYFLAPISWRVISLSLGSISVLIFLIVVLISYIGYRRLPVVKEKRQIIRILNSTLSQSDEAHARHAQLLQNIVIIDQDEQSNKSKENERHSACLANFAERLQKIFEEENYELRTTLRLLQQQFVTDGLKMLLLKDAKIPGIGPKLKETLLVFGITSADDIEMGRLSTIPGIGQAKASALVLWRGVNETILRAQQPRSLPNNVLDPIKNRFDSRRENINAEIDSENQCHEATIETITKKYELMRNGNSAHISSVEELLHTLQVNINAYTEDLDRYRTITFINYLLRCLGLPRKSKIVSAVGFIGITTLLAGSMVFQGTIATGSTVSMIIAAIPTSTSTATPTSTPTFTPTSSVTPTLTQTATATITETPTITSTSTITPTPSITLPSAVGSECIPANPREVGTLYQVIDGDTIDVLLDGKIQRVRYIGIDTPEVTTAVEYFGYQSYQKNVELLSGQTLYLIKDVSETDSFGRLLRYVIAGNNFVNYELVKQGYARAMDYPPDSSCASTFQEIGSQAKSSQSGMWLPTATTQPIIYQPPAPSGGGGCNCGVDYDCGNFGSHSEAQACYDSCGGGNWSGLDRDLDGLACESLP